MLRAAFITDAPRIAGSEIWLLETLPKLPQQRISPAVFLPSSSGLARLKELLEARGVPTHTYPSHNALVHLTENYDVRILQAWYPKTYLLLKKLPSPKAVFLHDQLEYHYPFGIKRLYQLIYGATKASKLKDADAVLVGTHWAAHYLRRHFGLETQVVAVGVDPDRFRPPLSRRAASPSVPLPILPLHPSDTCQIHPGKESPSRPSNRAPHAGCRFRLGGRRFLVQGPTLPGPGFEFVQRKVPGKKGRHRRALPSSGRSAFPYACG